MDGVLLFDKPILWTSHDAVDFVRRKIGQKSVGHAGTLDPLATGLLLLLIGKYTKKMNELADLEKEYACEAMLGIETESFDMEGRITRQTDSFSVTADKVKEMLLGMTGEQLQTPPQYSAIKKDGVKMYELARRGIQSVIAPRPITVREIQFFRFEFPCVTFSMSCTKGTYVRSFAQSLGEKLGCGAVLSALCRTRIGHFVLKDALNEETILNMNTQSLEKNLLIFP